MQRFYFFVICSTLLVTMPIFSALSSENKDIFAGFDNNNWSNSYGNYKLNGSSSIGTIDNVAHLIYKNNFDSYLNSPVIDNNDNIYISSFGEGELISINQSTMINWRIKLSNSYITYPLIIGNENLVIGTNNHLYCVFLNGTIRWEYPVMANIHNLNFFNGKILFTCQNNELICLSDVGKFQWRTKNISFDSTPAFDDDGNIYIGAGNDIISLFPNGTLKWNISTQHTVGGSPMVAIDGIITPSSDGFLYYIYFNGSLKWRKNYSPIAIAGVSCSQDYQGNIYFVDRSGNLNSIDTQGNLNWRYTIGGPIRSSPTICRDNIIYIANFEGYLYSLNQNGSLKWKRNVGNRINTNVAINQSGFLTVVTQNGDLIIYGPEVPNEPYILSTTINEYGINIEWSKVINTGGPILLGYNIYRSENKTDFKLLSSVGPSNTTFLDKDVKRSKEYTYYLTAFNRIGESIISNYKNIKFQKKPETVIIKKTISYDGMILINWNYPLDIEESEIEYFSLFRSSNNISFQLVSTIGENTNVFNDTNLVNGLKYYYYITVTNRIGESNISNIVNETPIGPPSVPLNLTNIANFGPIHLVWSPPLNNGGKKILYYNIYRNYSENNMTLIGKSNNTSFIDYNISYGILFLYRISAISVIGESTLSETQGIIAYNIPNPPKIKTIKNIDRNISIQWDQTKYTGGLEIEEIIIYRSTNNLSFYKLSSINSDSNIFIDDSIEIGKHYYYYIKNLNELGISSPSNIVNIKHQITPYFEGIKLITSGVDFINIQLGDFFSNGCKIESIKLLRGNNIDNLMIVNNFSEVPKYINDSTLSENTEYFYDIEITYIINDKEKTIRLDKIYRIKTKERPVKIYPPPNLDISLHVEDKTIIISWSVNDTLYDQEYYIHIYRNSLKGEHFIGNFSSNNNNYLDRNVSQDIKYSYKLKVYNSNNNVRIINSTNILIKSNRTDKENNYSLYILVSIILIMLIVLVMVSIILYKNYSRKDSISNKKTTEEIKKDELLNNTDNNFNSDLDKEF